MMGRATPNDPAKLAHPLSQHHETSVRESFHSNDSFRVTVWKLALIFPLWVQLVWSGCEVGNHGWQKKKRKRKLSFMCVVQFHVWITFYTAKPQCKCVCHTNMWTWIWLRWHDELSSTFTKQTVMWKVIKKTKQKQCSACLQGSTHLAL